jgi:hypothetical protein
MVFHHLALFGLFNLVFHCIFLANALWSLSSLFYRCSFQASKISTNPKEEIATISFEQELTKNSEIVLSIEYTGHHNEKMTGFYRSQYTDAKTKDKKYLVVTQFEPTGTYYRIIIIVML